MVKASGMQPGIKQRGLWMGGLQRAQALGQQIVAPHQRKAGQPLATPLAELLGALLRIVGQHLDPWPHPPPRRGARRQQAAAGHAHLRQFAAHCVGPLLHLRLGALHQRGSGAIGGFF